MARARMIRARRTPTRARAKARTKARIGNQVWAPSQFPLALGFNKVHLHSQGRAYAHRCVSPVSFTVHEGGVPRLPFLCYCIACLSIAARCRYIFGVYYTGTDVAVFVVYYTSIDVAVFCCTSGQSVGGWRKLLYSGFETCFAPSTLKFRFCAIEKKRGEQY